MKATTISRKVRGKLFVYGRDQWCCKFLSFTAWRCDCCHLCFEFVFFFVWLIKDRYVQTTVSTHLWYRLITLFVLIFATQLVSRSQRPWMRSHAYRNDDLRAHTSQFVDHHRNLFRLISEQWRVRTWHHSSVRDMGIYGRITKQFTQTRRDLWREQIRYDPSYPALINHHRKKL